MDIKELRFRQYKSDCNIADTADFELWELVHLEEQYRDCNPDHIKTKQTLLSMILEIKKKLGI